MPEKKHNSFTLSAMKTAILVHYCCERKIPRLELSPVPLTSQPPEVYNTLHGQLIIGEQVFPLCPQSTIT